MPFITEEIWRSHPVFSVLVMRKEKPMSIALAQYPQPENYRSDVDAENQMALLQSLIVGIRAVRKEIGVEEKASVPIEFRIDAGLKNVISENSAIIERLARVTEIRFVDQISAGLAKHATPQFDLAVVYERKIDVAAECEKLNKEIAKQEKNVASADRQLGNPAFTAKAPAHIVEGLKKQREESQHLLDKLRADRDSLGC